MGPPPFGQVVRGPASRARTTDWIRVATRTIPFEVPYGPDREARLGSVLDVICLIFNEGYAATAGDDWLRPSLCEDALRLARVLSALMSKEPEGNGLTALLEFQAARTAAAGTACSSPAAACCCAGLRRADRPAWSAPRRPGSGTPSRRWAPAA